MVLIVPTLLLFASSYPSSQEEEELPTMAVIQETQMSVQDPLPGHEGHQIVLALPPSENGIGWLGK
jgi:hypothetical protein